MNAMRPPTHRLAAAASATPDIAPEGAAGSSSDTSRTVRGAQLGAMPSVTRGATRRRLGRSRTPRVLFPLALLASVGTACASGGSGAARLDGGSRVVLADTASRCWGSVALFAGYIERPSARTGLTAVATENGLLQYGIARDGDSVRVLWRDFGAMRHGLGGAMSDLGAHYLPLANPGVWPVLLTAPTGEKIAVHATPGDSTPPASWCQVETLVFEVQSASEPTQVMRIKRGLRGSAISATGWVLEVRR